MVFDGGGIGGDSKISDKNRYLHIEEKKFIPPSSTASDVTKAVNEGGKENIPLKEKAKEKSDGHKAEIIDNLKYNIDDDAPPSLKRHARIMRWFEKVKQKIFSSLEYDREEFGELREDFGDDPLHAIFEMFGLTVRGIGKWITLILIYAGQGTEALIGLEHTVPKRRQAYYDYLDLNGMEKTKAWIKTLLAMTDVARGRKERSTTEYEKNATEFMDTMEGQRSGEKKLRNNMADVA